MDVGLPAIITQSREEPFSLDRSSIYAKFTGRILGIYPAHFSLLNSTVHSSENFTNRDFFEQTTYKKVV